MHQSIQLNIHLPFSYWQKRDADTGAPLCRPAPVLTDAYFRALEMEIASLGEDLTDVQVSSVCFRGGYMSLAEPEMFRALLCAVHRSFSLREDAEISGVLFPGSLDMARISAYRDCCVGPLMFEVPSLLARECQRQALPNALQALDQTRFLMENFGYSDFGLRLPIGIPGRDEGMWRHILGQINHYQPTHVAFYDISGGACREHPAFDVVLDALRGQGLREAAPRFFTTAPCAPAIACTPAAYAGVGLGAQTRLDGFVTRNTQDMNHYIKACADYRQVVVFAQEVSD